MNKSQITDYLKQLKNIKVSKKLLTFSFFLVLSSVFWVLNALDKEYTTTVKFPIVFYNFPENKTLINNIHRKIDVKITAYGYDIIGKIKSTNKILKVNFKKFALTKNKKSDTNSYYILTGVFQKKINEILGANSKILNIYPDSLNFTLANITSRKVTIKPNIKLNLGKMFMQTDEVKVIPSEVKISGFKSQLDTIKYVETELLETANLSDSVNLSLKLKSIEGVKFSFENVKVSIPVEKFTEKSVKAGVNILNLPDSLKMILFPKKVKIRFKVGLRIYNKITAADFKINVSYKNTNSKKMKISIVEMPDNIKITAIFPEYIDYIIEKNK